MHERKSKNIIRFEKENHKRMRIEVTTNNVGRIKRIDNMYNLPFPFVEGQLMTRDYKTWACKRGYLINGESPKCDDGSFTDSLDESESIKHLEEMRVEKSWALVDKMTEKLVTFFKVTDRSNPDVVIGITYGEKCNDIPGVPIGTFVPVYWTPESEMYIVEHALWAVHTKWWRTILEEKLHLDEELVKDVMEQFGDNIFEYVEGR